MELHFTSGYHPEGDSQMECINQVLEQYLRAYTNYQQDDWATLLPLAEFTYNNAPSETMGVLPFFTNKGYHPNLSMDTTTVVPSMEAQQFVAHLDEIHDELKQNIVDAQEQYQKGADWHHLPAPPFKVGDKVFVKARVFKTTWPSKKLSEKNLGPYEIISTPGSHSFTLRLPSQFWAVHPIFHISQLEPAVPNPFPNWTQPPPPPIEIDGESEYEVSEILDSKTDWRFKADNGLCYLVRWSGYEGTDEETSWISAQDLKHTPDLILSFHHQFPHRPKPAPSSGSPAWMNQHEVVPNSFYFIFHSLAFISLNFKWSIFYYQFLLSVSLISFPPLNSSYISFSMKSVSLTLCSSHCRQDFYLVPKPPIRTDLKHEGWIGFLHIHTMTESVNWGWQLPD